VSEPRPKKRTGVLGICGTHSLGRNFVYETQLLEGVQNVVQEAGMELQLLSGASAIGWDKVDGVLHYYGSGKLQHLPPDTPNVSLLNPRAGFHCVLADDISGALTATQHLLEQGHRRIALLTTREKNFHERRLAGYENALRGAGIAPQAEWVRPIISFERSSGYIGSGRDTMRDWLQSDWHDLGCTALLAQNDDTAIGVIRACAEAGISVPEGLSVVGFDGAGIAEWFLPRLTTMQVPFRKIGARGARLLLELIRNPLLPVTQIDVPVRLRIGETTAPCAQDALCR
jgi:LacI family transcriptional regulator